MSSSQAGEDALNLYDVAALAHFDLYRAMVATHHTTDLDNASDLRGDMHDQLGLAAQIGRTGPFGLADPAIPTDTVSHALGYASEARLYAAMTGDRSFERSPSSSSAGCSGPTRGARRSSSARARCSRTVSRTRWPTWPVR